MPRILRRTLFWAGMLYLLTLPLSFIIGGALFARPVKDPVRLGDVVDAMEPHWDRTFLSGVTEAQIFIGPRTRLRATVLGGDSHATVIVLHESRKNRLSGLAAAYALWSGGFDVVLLDRRAHGSSDGDVLPLFGGEQADLTKVIDYVINEGRTGSSRIGLFGIGDAGTSCLIAAAADPRVDAVVAEDPALTAGDFVSSVLHSWFLLPEPLLVGHTFLAVQGLCLIGDVESDQLDASPLLGRLSTRTLLLSNRQTGRSDRVRAVHDALPMGVSEFTEADDQAGLYQRMVSFFDQHL